MSKVNRKIEVRDLGGKSVSRITPDVLGVIAGHPACRGYEVRVSWPRVWSSGWKPVSDLNDPDSYDVSDMNVSRFLDECLASARSASEQATKHHD